MKTLEEAVVDFESETAVERQLFLLLAESSGECEDVVALRQAGTRIAEAAGRLLQVLDEDAVGRVPVVAGDPQLAP